MLSSSCLELRKFCCTLHVGWLVIVKTTHIACAHHLSYRSYSMVQVIIYGTDHVWYRSSATVLAIAYVTGYHLWYRYSSNLQVIAYATGHHP